MLCYAGTARFNDLLPAIQSVLTDDYTRLAELNSRLHQLSPEDQAAFRQNRLSQLLFSYLASQLVSIQFSGSRFMEMVVQILLWLLLEKPAEKEQAPLLRMLRMCTSRDAVRFRDMELRELMMKLCGKESEGVTEIGWFYREYCTQWLEMVREEGRVECSASRRGTLGSSRRTACSSSWICWRCWRSRRTIRSA